MFCSCFVVFSLKSLLTGRQSGPEEILRCDYGCLSPRNLEMAALYHISFVTKILVMHVKSHSSVDRMGTLW